jgi:putative membrane protein
MQEVQEPFEAGAARRSVPFERIQGFGELGVQVAAIRTGGQTTAWILIDGNNMLAGAREEMRSAVLALVDECEFMTTDTHVVNTLSGRNPIGLAVPAGDLLPFVLDAVQAAISDLAPAGAAGSTAWIDGVRIFGYGRIGQLGATVASLIAMLGPLATALFVVALIATLGAYRYLA